MKREEIRHDVYESYFIQLSNERGDVMQIHISFVNGVVTSCFARIYMRNDSKTVTLYIEKDIDLIAQKAKQFPIIQIDEVTVSEWRVRKCRLEDEDGRAKDNQS